MDPTLIVGTLGALLLLAFIANRLFRLTRVPDVVVLMACGVLLGPGFHLIKPTTLAPMTQLLGTLAIILVLFEGGLELKLRTIARHLAGSILMSTVTYALSVAAVAYIASKLMGMPFSHALPIGAVLGCTSSTIVLPVLQQMGAREPVRILLTLESTLGDVLAVLTAGSVLHMSMHTTSALPRFMNNLFSQILVAVLLGVLLGAVWSRLLRVLADRHFWQVATFGVVLLLYTAAESLEASGLVAVLVFGLTLSNFPGFDPRLHDKKTSLALVIEQSHEVLAFHSELSFLTRTFFFIVIGVVAVFHGLRNMLLLIAAVTVALFLARWLGIQLTRWSWREIAPHERNLILWMFPRGLVTAVLAIKVALDKGQEMAFLPTLAFVVILITNLLLIFASRFAKEPAPAKAKEPPPKAPAPAGALPAEGT